MSYFHFNACKPLEHLKILLLQTFHSRNFVYLFNKRCSLTRQNIWSQVYPLFKWPECESTQLHCYVNALKTTLNFGHYYCIKLIKIIFVKICIKLWHFITSSFSPSPHKHTFLSVCFLLTLRMPTILSEQIKLKTWSRFITTLVGL